jgi:large subunit ribosomal protein L17
MRHRIYGKQLNRTSAHRRAMIRNLASGLFEHGRIETTMPKAKAVQPFVEKVITTAKRGGLHARRQVEAMINDRKIHAWVADPNVPDERKTSEFFELPDRDQIEFNRYGEVRKAPRLVQHIMGTVAPLFAERAGGYTRIVKLDKHRLGDGADLVVLELVGEEEGPQIGGRRSRRRQQADNRTAYAAQLRKGGATAVAEPEPAPEATEAEPEDMAPATAGDEASAEDEAASEGEKADG